MTDTYMISVHDAFLRGGAAKVGALAGVTKPLHNLKVVIGAGSPLHGSNLQR